MGTRSNCGSQHLLCNAVQQQQASLLLLLTGKEVHRAPVRGAKHITALTLHVYNCCCFGKLHAAVYGQLRAAAARQIVSKVVRRSCLRLHTTKLVLIASSEVGRRRIKGRFRHGLTVYLV